MTNEFLIRVDERGKGSIVIQNSNRYEVVFFLIGYPV